MNTLITNDTINEIENLFSESKPASYKNEYKYCELAIDGLYNRNNMVDSSYKFKENSKECSRSLFLFNDEMKKHYKETLNKNGSNTTAKFKGSVYANDFVIDVDSKSLNQAHIWAKEIVSRIVNYYDAKEECIKIYFSGSKGFHICIPSEMFQAEPSASLPEIMGAVCKTIVSGVDSKAYDKGIYQHIHLIREPNTINSKSGLYKIPLTYDELLSLSIDDIKLMAKQPRIVFYHPAHVNKGLKVLYQIEAAKINNKIKNFPKSIEKKINFYTKTDTLIFDCKGKFEKNDSLLPFEVYETTIGIRIESKVIFKINHVVYDTRLINLIRTCILKIYPNLTYSNKKFSSAKESIKFDGYIDVLEIFRLAVKVIIGCSTEVCNQKRDLTRFYAECCIATIGSYPVIGDLSILQPSEMSMETLFSAIKASDTNGFDFDAQKVDVFVANPIIIRYIYTNSKCREYVRFFQNKNFFVGWHVPEGFAGLQNLAIDDLVRCMDFDSLKSCCELFSEFAEGERKLNHDERFGISTNLIKFKGGAKLFLDILSKNSHLGYDVSKWELDIKAQRHLDYLPMACDNFCPYAETCNHAKNIIQQSKQKSFEPIKLKDIDYISIDEMSLLLQESYKKVIDSNPSESKVYVIKAPVGIGKTEMMLRCGKKKDILYCLPSHDLKNEVYNRGKSIGLNIEKTPEIPDELSDETKEELSKLYSLGMIHKATVFIAKKAKEKDENNEFTYEAIRLQKYLSDMGAAVTHEGCCVTTQHKLMNMTEINQQYIFIDEDVSNVLISHKSINFKSLISFRDSLEEEIDKLECFGLDNETKFEMQNDVNKLVKLIENILLSVPKIKTEKENDFYDVVEEEKIFWEKKYEKLLLRYQNSPLIGLLNAEWFVRDTEFSANEYDFYVHYIERKNIPCNKTICIQSATANKYVYEKLFGDRLVWIDLGNVKNQGSLIQDTSYSCSRAALNMDYNIQEAIRTVIKNHNITNTITFKSHKANFNTIICATPLETLHYGNCMGYDKYNGVDTAIIGTPHMNNMAYIMFGYAIGENFTIDDLEFGLLDIEKNGFRFKFNTFKNKVLQDIQLWMIESELIQAIGRVRLIRNNSKVLLFSNYPMQQALFIQDARRIKKELKQIQQAK